MFEYVHMRVGAHRRQKKTSDSLKMELQGVVNHQMWVNIRSLGRTSALICLPISLVPYLIFLFKFKKSTEFRELE